MNQESAIDIPEKKVTAAPVIGAVYFVGGLLVAGYFSYLNPSRTQSFFLNYVFWGVPFILFAAGYRRDPKGALGWVLIILGWFLLLVNLGTCSSDANMRGQISEIGNAHMQKAILLARENEEALIDAGWYDFPNPNQLRDDSNLASAKETLSRVREIFERQDMQADKIRKEWISAIKSLDGPQYKIDENVALVEGFYSDSEAALDRISRAQFELVSEAERLVDFLANNRNAWTVEQDRFVFAGDDEANEFDQHIQKMHALDMDVNAALEAIQQYDGRRPQ